MPVGQFFGLFARLCSFRRKGRAMFDPEARCAWACVLGSKNEGDVVQTTAVVIKTKNQPRGLVFVFMVEQVKRQLIQDCLQQWILPSFIR